MTRFVGDQLEQDQPQRIIFKNPPAPAAASSSSSAAAAAAASKTMMSKCIAAKATGMAFATAEADTE